MKKLLTIILATSGFLSIAQTDIIEMRSRNASLKKYEINVKSNRSDLVTTNFGGAPMPLVKTAVLDSVKSISDSVAIMYTSEYCSRGLRQDPEAQQRYDQQHQRNRTYSNPKVGRLWQPGADTIINHPLFRHRHSLDSVKAVIDRDYHFNLPSDSILFIGFDNGLQNNSIQNGIEQRQISPQQKQNGFGWEIFLFLLTPIACVVAILKFTLPSSNH